MNFSPAGPILMNAAGRSRIVEVPTAHATLMDLCRPFLPDGNGSAFVPECAVVQPEEIPYPADQLLVHHEHMTVTLEKFHGSPVDVRVIEEHLSGDGGFGLSYGCAPCLKDTPWATRRVRRSCSADVSG